MPKAKRDTPKQKQEPNIIIVSDTHCGCQLGLCPPKGIRLDEGGRYSPNAIQRKVWRFWETFWEEWVPEVTHGEPFILVINGDSIDGVHHNSTTQISYNMNDQRHLAVEIFGPLVERASRLYMIRGTEAHVGKSGVDEETIAAELNAIPNDEGQYARYELWFRLGKGLIHFLHHIGTTGASAYESTAVHKELVEMFNDAGKWKEEPPAVVVRSHRHRNFETRCPSDIGYGISFTTACWQAKTPLCFRAAGPRVSTPQFGGSLIRQGDQDLYTRHKIWTIGRSKEER